MEEILTQVIEIFEKDDYELLISPVDLAVFDGESRMAIKSLVRRIDVVIFNLKFVDWFTLNF